MKLYTLDELLTFRLKYKNDYDVMNLIDIAEDHIEQLEEDEE
jgi:hypothetical protein